MVYIGETRLPFGQEPLLLYGGGLTLQTSSGSVQAILLDTHSFMSSEPPTTDDQVSCFVLIQLYIVFRTNVVPDFLQYNFVNRFRNFLAVRNCN